MGNNSFPCRLLSQKAAAAYLGISYWTLRDLCFRGDIPYVRVKRRLLVDRVDLEAYIARCKIPPRG
jgi:excisionase family DNA binding protein